MEIKEIQESDLKEYLKLRKASEQEYPQYVGASVEAELAAGEDGIKILYGAYGSQGHHIFGVFEGDKLLGVASLTRKNSQKYRHKAFLWGMYIYPEYRKAGISGFLMDHCLSWAKDQEGLLAITLFVTATNEAGKKFYEKYGFECYGTEKRHMFAAGEFHDAHLYELVL